MFGRVARAIHGARENAKMVGWGWVAADRVLRRLKVPEVRVRPRGLRDRVAVRIATSDMYEFNHLLGRDQKPFRLPIDAEYIVDAGANVGYAALRFALDFPRARIVAIEPSTDNARQLTRNCAAYPEISVEQAALWPTNTRLRIKDADADHNAFQIIDDPDGDIAALTVGEVMTRHGFPRIDILKIDIEGSEKVVFASGTEWLAHVRYLLVETHDRFIPGCTETVERAVAGQFVYRGIDDEYHCYERLARVDA